MADYIQEKSVRGGITFVFKLKLLQNSTNKKCSNSKLKILHTFTGGLFWLECVRKVVVLSILLFPVSIVCIHHYQFLRIWTGVDRDHSVGRELCKSGPRQDWERDNTQWRFTIAGLRWEGKRSCPTSPSSKSVPPSVPPLLLWLAGQFSLSLVRGEIL